MSRLPLAGQIMVTKLVTVAPEDDVLHGIGRLLRHRVSGAPVVDSEGRYLGMLSDRRCMRVLYVTALEAGVDEKRLPLARDFMSRKLLTLRPESDAIEAISTLLKQRFSGASVVDEGRRFLGVFSERYIMRLLIHSAYEQVPSTRVEAFMNTDRARLIDETMNLLEVARTFQDTYYRRLPVSKDEKLIGQVSPYDVLNAEHHLTRFLTGRQQSGGGELPTTPISKYMDTSAETITEDMDLLVIARIFLDSNRRRLPVLRDGKLIGQVSRRDLLLEVLDLLAKQPQREQPGLFLSAISDPTENPILRDSDRPSGGTSPRRS